MWMGFCVAAVDRGGPRSTPRAAEVRVSRGACAGVYCRPSQRARACARRRAQDQGDESFVATRDILVPIGTLSLIQSDKGGMLVKRFGEELAAPMARLMQVYQRANMESAEMMSDPAKAREMTLEFTSVMEKVAEAKAQIDTRILLSGDFMLLQISAMQEALLQAEGISKPIADAWLAYKLECMSNEAVSAGRAPPPPPPASLRPHIATLSRLEQQSSMGFRLPQSQYTFTDFMRTAFQDVGGVGRAELEKLGDDTTALVKLGESYGTFDRAGKLAYIDQVEKMDERWFLLFKRYQLLNKLGPEYFEFTDQYLKDVQLKTPQEYHQLLARARNLMREAAERT
ncbi:hypothetical protein FVE85_8871 [Porphyridium purpureum]|uniref:Uncharacterized protein n=1 Tax=Porphyridium purpureum TaxID=35688 RepID=A0A5J4YQ70_PORPP|nr:hypothetical protein FVE85_8871 [Porphyridium purpureum]|eukprot:POR9457..scf296_7